MARTKSMKQRVTTTAQEIFGPGSRVTVRSSHDGRVIARVFDPAGNEVMTQVTALDKDYALRELQGQLFSIENVALDLNTEANDMINDLEGLLVRARELPGFKLEALCDRLQDVLKTYLNN